MTNKISGWILAESLSEKQCVPLSGGLLSLCQRWLWRSGRESEETSKSFSQCNPLVLSRWLIWAKALCTRMSQCCFSAASQSRFLFSFYCPACALFCDLARWPLSVRLFSVLNHNGPWFSSSLHLFFWILLGHIHTVHGQMQPCAVNEAANLDYVQDSQLHGFVRCCVLTVDICACGLRVCVCVGGVEGCCNCASWLARWPKAARQTRRVDVCQHKFISGSEISHWKAPRSASRIT